MKEIKLHADDLGFTKEINKNISKSIDEGAVKSVSLIVNGYALDDAIEKIYSKNIVSYIHLNLSLGKPISKDILVSKYLCDQNQYFNLSFIKLFFYNFILSKIKRDNLKNAIKIELEKQIQTYIKKTNKTNIYIDSHEHFHLLPIILDAILLLKKKYNIRKIRVPKEKINFFDIMNLYNFVNILKVLILNKLSINLIKKIKLSNIKFNKFFIGVLNTNNMKIKNILKCINKLNVKDYNELIILIHPGYSPYNEGKYFKKRKEWAYFNSKKRLDELNLSINIKNINF